MSTIRLCIAVWKSKITFAIEYGCQLNSPNLTKNTSYLKCDLKLCSSKQSPASGKGYIYDLFVYVTRSQRLLLWSSFAFRAKKGEGKNPQV